jgi:hypothetical protein
VERIKVTVVEISNLTQFLIFNPNPALNPQAARDYDYD